MAKTKIKFLEKPTCTTCRKAKEYLEKLGAELELRSLDAQPLSEAELDKLIGTRDYKLFLSQRNEFYRTKNMAEKPPTRQEAIKYMAKVPNLIRRPVAIRGDQIVLGYNEEAYKKLLE
jgi:Spx/MgsR family transcriptional regulator